MNGISSDIAGSPNHRLTPTQFEYRNRKAHSVSVAGSFNDWNPESGSMIREYRDLWVRTIPLGAGNYEYCLVVDGRWILDPLNQASVGNPFGGRNSVFTVLMGDEEGRHGREAEREPILHQAEDQRERLQKRAAKLCRDFNVSTGAE